MHEIIDQASLEMAKRIATRVRTHPSLLDVARENLVRWKERNADSPRLMRNYVEWEQILERPLEEILAILCAETDEGQRLRQNSPFGRILTPQEVWEIKKEYRNREAART
jgi:hypothetical protein